MRQEVGGDVLCWRRAADRRFRPARLSWESFQALQVIGERLEFFGTDGDDGHVVSGFDALRVGDPAGEIAFVVGQSSGSDGDAAADMREIRGDAACGRGTANGVAENAR